MYLDHYQLKLMPFEIGPDPKFLWLGSKHFEAHAILRYGILESKGFIVIIGEPGTGKSTLLNAATANFGTNIRFAKITDPALQEMDFFNFVANEFEMGKTFQSKSEFMIQLGEFVKDAEAQSKKVILVIDEAQRLTPAMLEQIRVFSNIETPGQKVVSCIFAGQNEFLDLVNQNRALAQRVFFRHVIQPLTQSEMGDYIAHRLKVAGTEEPIFTSAAVQEVFRLSGGNPRLINILCDQALLSGYAADTRTIGPELITEGTENTLIPLNTKKESAAEAQKQKAAKQSTATAPTAANTTEPSRIAPAKTDIRTPGRKTAYWAPIALTAVLGLAAYFYLNDGFRAAPTGGQMVSGQAQGSAQPAATAPDGGEIARLQAQMLELRRQKDDSEARLKELQAQLFEINNQKGAAEAQLGEVKKRNTGLAAGTQELKSAQDRVAQFEAAVLERDKKLIQLEQKLGELEKALAKEIAEKDQLGAELSSRQAAIADFQKRIEAAGSTQLKLEADIQNTQRENARLQSQLQEVKAQKPAPPPTPAPARAPATSRPPPVPPDTAGAAPDPAGVIDYVIKRKSQ
jgi:type II secretory pathway predicted ATPase ExeA